MRHENWINGVLRERWDDSTRQYTAWNESGVQTSQRAYTAAENTAADQRAGLVTAKTNENSIAANLQQDIATMQGYIDMTNANLNSAMASNSAAIIKDMARAIRRLAKRELNDYGTV